jgi:hypothetical protein
MSPVKHASGAQTILKYKPKEEFSFVLARRLPKPTKSRGYLPMSNELLVCSAR